MMRLLISFLVGFVFAIGLGVSGMTQPQKVVAFLDIFGGWNPALAFVMIGAIFLHAALYPLITRRSSPILDDQFHLPKKSDLSPSLLLGATLFGLGWGIGGFCPGPAITSLASGNSESLIFVTSMVAGMFLFKLTKPLVDRWIP